MQFSDPELLGHDFQLKVEKVREIKIHQLMDSGFDPKKEGSKAMTCIKNIVRAEKPVRARLEQLAVKIARDHFPVIDIAKISIKAEITDFGNCVLDTPSEPRSIDPTHPLYKKAGKRKIMNAITQAAGISMNTIHHAVKELDDIDTGLKQYYDIVHKTNEVGYVLYDKKQLTMMAQELNKNNMATGLNQVTFIDHNPVIIAKAVSFVYLVHEIVKGVYEYLSLNAHDDEDEYDEIVEFTDSLEDEAEDIACGEIIRNGIRDFLIDNHDDLYQHPAFYEMFLVSMARLEAEEMIKIVNGILHGYPDRRKIAALARDAAQQLKTI